MNLGSGGNTGQTEVSDILSFYNFALIGIPFSVQ